MVMKLNFPQIQNFSGHAAGKIKALYMQNACTSRQLPIYNELRKIGQKEGFDVFIHGSRELIDKELTENEKYSFWSVWSQDNKIITKKDGKNIIISPESADRDEHNEVVQLACLSANEAKYGETVFDGGNIYLGKRDNGEKYLITSDWTASYSTAYQYLKSKNLPNLNKYSLNKFIEEHEWLDEKGRVLASEEECIKDVNYWYSLAALTMCEEFGVESKNLIFLPEADYHIDLVIRPLDYPYVLVNDENEVNRFLDELRQKYKFSISAKSKIAQFEKEIARLKKAYDRDYEISEILEKNGFIPIKIAGAFGRGPINYMNAIVQQTSDGLVYITNSSKCHEALYCDMEEKFRQELMQKCPQIKRVYFVSGDMVDKNTNIMMDYLKNYLGGIHCLCCEEMED